VCPPSFRNQVVLGYHLTDHEATLHELRTICGVPGSRHEVPVARLRLQPDGRWTLESVDIEGHWRRHRSSPHRSFVALLRVLDEDCEGLFWGSVNGKSLRWCSSRGRCAECTDQYHAILGGEPSRSRVVPLVRVDGVTA